MGDKMNQNLNKRLEVLERKSATPPTAGYTLADWLVWQQARRAGDPDDPPWATDVIRERRAQVERTLALFDDQRSAL